MWLNMTTQYIRFEDLLHKINYINRNEFNYLSYSVDNYKYLNEDILNILYFLAVVYKTIKKIIFSL